MSLLLPMALHDHFELLNLPEVNCGQQIHSETVYRVPRLVTYDLTVNGHGQFLISPVVPFHVPLPLPLVPVLLLPVLLLLLPPVLLLLHGLTTDGGC